MFARESGITHRIAAAKVAALASHRNRRDFMISLLVEAHPVNGPLRFTAQAKAFGKPWGVRSPRFEKVVMGGPLGLARSSRSQT